MTRVLAILALLLALPAGLLGIAPQSIPFPGPGMPAATPLPTLSRVFNGSSDSLTHASASAFSFTNAQAFTISVWAYITISPDGNDHALVSKLDSNSPYSGYELLIQQGGADWTLGIYLVNTFGSNAIAVRTDETAGGTISINAWHNLVMTYDGSDSAAGVKFYIDGALETKATPGQDTLSATIANSIQLSLGARNNAAAWITGRLARAEIWNIALSGTDVTAEQSCGAVQTGNLKGKWLLSGDSPEPDTSGQGNDVTVHGTTTTASRPTGC